MRWLRDVYVDESFIPVMVVFVSVSDLPSDRKWLSTNLLDGQVGIVEIWKVAHWLLRGLQLCKSLEDHKSNFNGLHYSDIQMQWGFLELPVISDRP